MRCGGRTILVILVAGIAVIAVAGALVVANVSNRAEHALTGAERAERRSMLFHKEFTRQKICADDTPEFCVDLFERLSDNITPRQQQLLACAVAVYTNAETVPGVTCPGSDDGP